MSHCNNNKNLFLAVDGGGTKAEFAIFNKDGNVLFVFKKDGNNPNFGGMDKTAKIMKDGIAYALDKYPSIHHVFIGNAGLLTNNNKDILQSYLQEAYPNLHIACDTDLVNLINLSSCKCSLIIGTGISIAVKDGNSFIRVGGQGHLIDKGGSAYHIGRMAIEKGLIVNNEFKQGESINASLAPQVFELYKNGNNTAKEIIENNAKEVANLINEVVDKYGHQNEIFVSGGLAEHFGDIYLPLINKYINIKFITSDLPQILGASKRCMNIFDNLTDNFESNFIKSYKEKTMISKTEERNPKTMNLSNMTTREMLEVMNEENMNAVKCIEKAFPEIEKAVDAASNSIANGGRLFYIGAGTSGRLGVVDASECPPTFGVDYDLVTGIIAGGHNSMFRASENAEDVYENGIRDIKEAGIKKGDTIVGISANGNAKYVIGALDYANEIGATTIALVCNYDTKIGKAASIEIVTDTGAEVITGSTRLKAGTAQKLVLNMISTFSMVKTGKVYENLMINLKPTNIKLKDRMVRIVIEILGCSYEEATQKLEDNNWVIKDAIKD